MARPRSRSSATRRTPTAQPNNGGITRYGADKTTRPIGANFSVWNRAIDRSYLYFDDHGQRISTKSSAIMRVASSYLS